MDNNYHKMRESLQPLQVALFTSSLSLSGAPRIALNLFNEISELVNIHTVAVKAGPLSNEFRKLGPVTVLPKGSIKSQLMATLRTPVVQMQLKLKRPDLIYVNTAAALFLLDTLHINNIPVLLHVHEMDSYLELVEQQYKKLLLDVPYRYIAVSEAVKDALMRRGISHDKISVIPAFIRVSDFDLQQIPKRSQNEPFIIGGSGYASWQKGTVLWLQMVAEVAKMSPNKNIRFVWIGIDNGIDSWAFQETARKLKIDHLIEFVPQTDNPIDYYKNFDIFALTSWEDSCPVAVLENMMLKKVVLCFAGSGGAQEELENTGIAVPDFSPVCMAEFIVELMQQPERCKQLGEMARIRAESYFTDQVQIPKIFDEICLTAQR